LVELVAIVSVDLADAGVDFRLLKRGSGKDLKYSGRKKAKSYLDDESADKDATHPVLGDELRKQRVT